MGKELEFAPLACKYALALLNGSEAHEAFRRAAGQAPEFVKSVFELLDAISKAAAAEDAVMDDNVVDAILDLRVIIDKGGRLCGDPLHRYDNAILISRRLAGKKRALKALEGVVAGAVSVRLEDAMVISTDRNMARISTDMIVDVGFRAIGCGLWHVTIVLSNKTDSFITDQAGIFVIRDAMQAAVAKMKSGRGRRVLTRW